eukprot:4400323-Pleurochrysis_carterae.AAC.1
MPKTRQSWLQLLNCARRTSKNRLPTTAQLFIIITSMTYETVDTAVTRHLAPATTLSGCSTGAKSGVTGVLHCTAHNCVAYRAR